MKNRTILSAVTLLFAALMFAFTADCIKAKISTEDFRKARSVTEVYKFSDSLTVVSFDLSVKLTDRVTTFKSNTANFTPEMMRYKEINSIKTRKYYIETIRVAGKDGAIRKHNPICVEFE